MSRPYKRNHIIPRCMLDYWVDNSGEYPGVHVYDINKKQIYKSEARGKKAFSFAFEDDLYIADINRQRAVSVERFLASIEGTLSQFIALAQNRSPINMDEREVAKLLMAFQSMELRSRYSFQLIGNYINGQQMAKPEKVKKLVLENFIDCVTTMAKKFVPLELTIVNSGEDSWLLSDRPYYYSPDIEHNLLVLSNKVLVGYRKSPNDFRYVYTDTPSVGEINRMIVLQARDWIASDNLGLLQNHIPIFNEPSWMVSKENDQVKIINLPAPIVGWEINN
jgi:Protein of unknown function (DUF4238)